MQHSTEIFFYGVHGVKHHKNTRTCGGIEVLALDVNFYFTLLCIRGCVCSSVGISLGHPFLGVPPEVALRV